MSSSNSSNAPPNGGGNPVHPNDATQPALGSTTAPVVAIAAPPVPSWPPDLPLSEKYINDPSWPSHLLLDLDKANWEQWSFRMEQVAQCQGFSYWLHGTYLQPSLSTNPAKHYTWQMNNESLHAFILQYLSVDDVKEVSHLPLASEVFACLRTRHVTLGTWVQCNSLTSLWSRRFHHSVSLEEH
jgi:hypothetical protein